MVFKPKRTSHSDFFPSEIAAMRYSYRQLLAEYPERFASEHARQELAKSVVNIQHRSVSVETVKSLTRLIRADDEETTLGGLASVSFR